MIPYLEGFINSYANVKRLRILFPWVEQHKKTISEFVELGDVRTILTINRKDIIAKSRKHIAWHNEHNVRR